MTNLEKALESLDVAEMWMRIASQAKCDEAHDHAVSAQHQSEMMARHFSPDAYAVWEKIRFPQD